MKLLSWLFHPVRRRELERILRLANDDIRQIGELVDLLDRVRDTDMRAQIEQALVRELPRLTEQDAGLLDAAQRNALYRTLHGRNTALVVTVLKTLERIGDRNALPYLERIAGSSKVGATDHERQIRHAASQCIPYLLARIDEAQVRQSLLRPSHYVEEQSGAELLRPSFVPCVPETARRYSDRDMAAGA